MQRLISQKMLQQILQYLIYFEDNNKLDNLFAFLNKKT